MTPAARLAAAIDLLDAIESASRRPADAVANDFFRARRYVGGGDRRAVSERVWGVLRRRLRLGWWLELVDARPTARLLVAVDLLLAEGLDLPAVLRAFPGGQYAAEALNGPEERALRAIAGRRRAGGKTLALAATMGNRGRLTACDVSTARLEGAVKRLRRAGVDNAERHLLESGDRWAKRRAGAFDRVLVDAPCTGTGTWRRNPDARTRTGPEDVRELLPKQAAILDAAAVLVRPGGGRLVYATCSLLPEEDEEQVRAFLGRHPDFAPLPLQAAWAEAGGSAPPPGEGEFLLTTPARHGTDGFFAAILQRGP